MIGTELHPLMPRITSMPSIPGQAEVEQDHIGVEVGGPVQPLLAAPGHHHLVAPGA